jgi:hypothetical protein
LDKDKFNDLWIYSQNSLKRFERIWFRLSKLIDKKLNKYIS